MGIYHPTKMARADFYKHTDTNSFVHVLRKKMRVSRFTWMRYVRGLEFRLSSARGGHRLVASLNLPHRHFFRNQPTCALEQLLPGGGGVVMVVVVVVVSIPGSCSNMGVREIIDFWSVFDGNLLKRSKIRGGKLSQN